MRSNQREVSIQHRIIWPPLKYLVFLIDGNRNLQVVVFSGNDYVLVPATPGVVDLDHIHLLSEFEIFLYEEEVFLVLTRALVLKNYRLKLAIEG